MVQEEVLPSRRLVGIDLGIASRHSVRVLEADGRVVCRSSCVSTTGSLTSVEETALAGAPEGTRLAVVFEPTGPAWLPIAVFFARRGHDVYRVSSAKAADLRRFLRRHAKSNRIAEISIEESVQRTDAEHRRGQDQYRHDQGQGGPYPTASDPGPGRHQTRPGGTGQ